MGERRNVGITESLLPGFNSITEEKIFAAFVAEVLLSFIIMFSILDYTSVLSSIAGVISLLAVVVIAVLIVQPFITYTVISAYYKKIKKKKSRQLPEVYLKLISVMILQIIIVAAPLLAIFSGMWVFFTLYGNTLLSGFGGGLFTIFVIALGIVLSVFLEIKLIFSFQELIIKNKGVWDSIRYSYRGTKNKFWKLVWFAFIFGISAVIVNTAINYVFGYNGSQAPTILVYASIFIESVIDSYISISLLVGITDYFIKALN
jgi:hypothetical protein